MPGALYPRSNRPSTPPDPLPETAGADWTAGGKAGDEQPVALERLLRLVRTRKRWILPALVLVPLLAGVLTARQAERYEATANLLFREDATDLVGENVTDLDPEATRATNEGLIELPVVSERTAEVLNQEPIPRQQHGGPLTMRDVQESVEVESTSQSNLVEIRAEAGEPFLAARMANVYGEQYIAFRQRSDRRQLQEAIEMARAGLEALPPEEVDGPAATSYRERLNRLETRRALLTGNAELVQRANVPTEPSSPPMTLNIALGVLLGGVLGLGMAAIRERFDETISSSEELEELYRVPVLMRLPRTRRLGSHGAGLPNSPEAEAFRILRSNLRFINVESGLQSILVSSPTAGDGKSTVAYGLASTMAELGDSVVLVEADLRKAASTARDATPRAGLATVLRGMPLDDALQSVPIGDGSRQLARLPAGPSPEIPTELLESSQMRTLLLQLEARFDVVVIDSPALTQVSDTSALVALVSGILIVSRLGQTRRSAAQDFRKQLRLLEGRPIGVVANFAPSTRAAGYY